MAKARAEKVVIVPKAGAVCLQCGTVHKMAAPLGWKRLGEGHICKDCWRKAYRVRAVAFPVMGVVEGGTKDEFQAAMKEAFGQSTALYNWCIRELLMADCTRTPDMERLPPAPKIDLYKRYNEVDQPLGNIATTTRSTIAQMARGDYFRYRVEFLWSQRQALPLKRYPAPFPVHNQSWRCEWTADGAPAISFRLHGEGDGPRWVLRLARGREFAYQMAGFRHLMEASQGKPGSPFLGQLDLYAQSRGDDGKGITITFKRTSGGQSIPCFLMAKLVGWFPRTERAADATETMTLATHPEAFLVAEIAGRVQRPWILNGDHVAASIDMMRRWTAQHAAWLQRIGEDRKHEKRWPLAQRRQFQDRYEKVCEKHRRRVTTWIDQMTAQVVGFAKRRKVCAVVYDDSNRDFVPSFQWYRLAALLERKCGEHGIDFVRANTGPAAVASGEAMAETSGAAREEELFP